MPFQEAQKRELHEALTAYFNKHEGCDLNWLLQVIGSNKAEARFMAEKYFKQYAGTQPYEDLFAATSP